MTKTIASILLALLLSTAVAAVLVLMAGGAPLEIGRVFYEGTWGSVYSIGQVLFKATPLIFCGLAVAVGLRAGLFNIGVEGQLLAGAFVMALVGAHYHGSAVVAVPMALTVGAAGGAVVAALAGLAKTTRGAHEVITTILFNFIIRAALVGVGPLVFLRESVHTARIQAAAELPRLGAFLPDSEAGLPRRLRWLWGLHGSSVNGALLLALVAVAAIGWMLRRTTFGFRIRALGGGAAAAESSGVPIALTTVLTMALSGALAGLGGASFVLGYKRYYEDGFSGGVGFMGIAVAVLAGARPGAIIAAAIVFGTLSQGAFAINDLVPKEIADVMQAIVIFAVVAARPLADRLMRPR